MADSMVAGLFGLTPEMYQNQQYQQDLKRGYELAQLSPGAAAQAGLQASVGQLGRGVAGLMGVEDPQMKIISARQQILGRLDQTNPTSMLEGAKMLAQMGDQQGAFALADYARKAQSEMALAQQRMREKAAADPFQKLVESGKYTPLSLAEYQRTGKPEDLELVKPEKAEPKTSYGPEADRVAKGRFGVNFSDLTQAQAKEVDDILEERGIKKAKESASKLTFPGQKEFADIPKFRADVQKTIAPQIQSVTAANQALEAINESITKNNFVSFNAARVQLAKALGDSQLSRRDVEQAGGDPSLFGRLLDSTSTLFTVTPTLVSQNLIKNTLNAIKKVSTNKANREIDVQRNIAYNTPGYDRARVDAALRFPDFEAATASPISGDVAAQARAILEQRKKASK
jgi:hypothetical protein